MNPEQSEVERLKLELHLANEYAKCLEQDNLLLMQRLGQRREQLETVVESANLLLQSAGHDNIEVCVPLPNKESSCDSSFLDGSKAPRAAVRSTLRSASRSFCAYYARDGPGVTEEKVPPSAEARIAQVFRLLMPGLKFQSFQFVLRSTPRAPYPEDLSAEFWSERTWLLVITTAIRAVWKVEHSSEIALPDLSDFLYRANVFFAKWPEFQLFQWFELSYMFRFSLPPSSS